MGNVARRHHTVPRFYLENFAGDGRIGTVILPGDRRFPQSTRRASTSTDFYLLGDPSGPDADAFERMLSTLEAKASVAIRSVLGGMWPLSVEARGVLAEFAAVQFLRGPNQRQSLEDFQAQFTRMEISLKGKNWMRDEFARHGQVLSDDEAGRLWGQATRKEGPPLVVSAEAHIKYLLETLPEIIWYFAARPWLLIRFQRHRLLTCDTPLSLVPGADTEPWHGVGLLTAWGIALPLSPEVGLLMTDPGPIAEHTTREYVAEGHLDREDPPSTVMARMFNEGTVRNARRFLYHHPLDAHAVPESLPDPVELEMEPLRQDFVAMGEALRRPPETQTESMAPPSE